MPNSPLMMQIITTGDKFVLAKLELANIRIALRNQAMVRGILEIVRDGTVPQIPIGPGHFGYHARNTFQINVTQKGMKTTGTLSAAVQAYWREFGTGGRYRGRSRHARLLASVRLMTGAVGTGGERAHLTATRLLSGYKRLINFYYGGLAAWWGS